MNRLTEKTGESANVLGLSKKQTDQGNRSLASVSREIGQLTKKQTMDLDETMKNASKKLHSLSSTAFAVALGLSTVGFVSSTAQANILDSVTETVSGFGGAGKISEETVSSDSASYTDAGANPFNIVVDGVTVFGDKELVSASDDQRTVDVAFEAMDIAVQVDVEDLNRAANIESIRRSVGKDAGNVQFFTYWNYGAFIKKAEVRIFKAAASVDGTPEETIAIVPGNATVWQATDKYGDELQYVMRLYDEKGNFDETEPKQLNIDATQKSSGDEDHIAKEALVAYGKNRLTTKNIELNGGSVTVSGKNVPRSHRLFIMGVPVPVSEDNEFVTREILPAGNHNVIVAALDETNKGLEFQRNLSIPANDWFYVALGDLTVGAGTSTGPTSLTGFENADETEVDVVGRAAFFLRGKVQGKYLVTALLDTTEDDIGNLLSNLTPKDPRNILKRVDPDKYYPIYGDDSTVEDLGASQGNLFLKIESDESHVLWGNYKTQIVGADLGQVRRSLYGAQLRYNSEPQTSFGEERFEVEAFAAKPESLPQTDEFRGTGGSVYFLKRQDLNLASDELRVEVRDNTTGVVLQSRKLVKDEDYDVDYVQGRIILFKPLASTADDGFIVANATLDGHPQYLVSRYEYTPAFTDVDGYSFGGRAQAWLGDVLRVGGTVHKEEINSTSKTLMEVDALVRLNAGTYIKGEFAQTDGVGDYTTSSSDGGYDTITTNTGVGTGQKANAYRLEAGAELGEFAEGLKGGKATAYYKYREAGFAAEGQNTSNDVADYGATASLPIGDFMNVRGAVNVSDNQTTGLATTTAKADADMKFADIFTAGVGLGYTTDSNGAARVDVGGKVGVKLDDYEAYAFAQGTVDKDTNRANNARYGIGGKAKITERLSLGGEISGGDGGIGAKATADFQVSDRTTSYLAYEVAGRTNTGGGSASSGVFSNNSGTLTFGGRSRYTEALTVFGEERISHDERGVSALTHAYGVNYAPSDSWTFGANFEHGTVKDTAGMDIKRTAAGATADFKTKGFNIGGGLEARIDNNEATSTERTTYLARVKSGMKFNPNWRMQAQLNLVMSEANGNFGDGDFIEGAVGFAYRPVNNDNLNALLKYQGYYDLPGSQQVTSTNAAANYKQRSHIFSADMIYQLSKTLSIGAKYGLKMGEVTSSRSTNDWQSSTTQLGILRADWHVVKNWDATVELRAMNQVELGSTRVGALAAIYRHFGDNLKLGVGYNFSDISDDLTNVNAGSQGVFFNAVTKF